MPDQSSAASEHALIQEITAPLATLPDDAMPIVADVTSQSCCGATTASPSTRT